LILDYHFVVINEWIVPYATRHKLSLANVVGNAERPLTPAEICKEARRDLPKLGIATVYRALKQFVAEGQVRLVEIPGVPPHYESATQQHHHFFFCCRCERLFNLLGCVRGVLGLTPKGFETTRHEIVLYGECADCRSHA
jgi:Fur family ferric uptake transcriptional regulator